MSIPSTSSPQLPAPRLIRFQSSADLAAITLATFSDPAPACAILLPPGSTPVDEDGALLAVAVLPLAESPGDPPRWTTSENVATLHVKSRSFEAWWQPGRAHLLCHPDRSQPLLAALAEFTFYHRELTLIESEIAQAWPQLDDDQALAFDVTPADLKRSRLTGARMAAAFRRRIRYARIEPHLQSAAPTLPPVARKLGAQLREAAEFQARSEAVASQLEVFEHIYEMSSQRLGEFRAAHQAHLIEWAIIWLLAAEAALMVLQTVLGLRH